MPMTARGWLRLYTKIVAGATVLLVYAGAMVTSTGSGLAVPDWPLSFGSVFPPMVGGVFYEHGHRMIATLVGFLTIIQAVALQRFEPRTPVRILGWVALGIVIVQGSLGGLTVLLRLPRSVSISHAALAEVFLCTAVAIAFLTSDSFERLRSGQRSERNHTRAGYLLVALVFIQALAGAWMRHLGAGLAIPDFPLSFGRLVPPLSSLPVIVNFSHRAGALVLLMVTLAVGCRIVREPHRAMRGILYVFLFALVTQVGLGACTIWTGKNPIVASFHVIIGATVLSIALLFVLIARTVARDRE
jgi:cytochrome c oxidase assembly protein subunit 15